MDSFTNKKKNFEGKWNSQKGQSNFRNEEQGGWNKPMAQVHEVQQQAQQQADDVMQPQKKQPRRQKNKTPSTFAQSAFSGGAEPKLQGRPRNEGSSSSSSSSSSEWRATIAVKRVIFHTIAPTERVILAHRHRQSRNFSHKHLHREHLKHHLPDKLRVDQR